METLWISNDHTVEVDALQDPLTGNYVNDATVTVRVKDYATDQDVLGQTWPLTLTYVTGSNGKYRGTIEDTLSLTHLRLYVLEVTAAALGGLQGFWRETARARYRQI